MENSHSVCRGLNPNQSLGGHAAVASSVGLGLKTDLLRQKCSRQGVGVGQFPLRTYMRPPLQTVVRIKYNLAEMVT